MPAKFPNLKAQRQLFPCEPHRTRLQALPGPFLQTLPYPKTALPVLVPAGPIVPATEHRHPQEAPVQAEQGQGTQDQGCLGEGRLVEEAVSWAPG